MPKLTPEQQEAQRKSNLEKLERMRGQLNPGSINPFMRIEFISLLLDILEYLIRR